MKAKLITLFFLVFTGVASSQGKQAEEALHQAAQMAEYFNNRNYTKYVDCLLPIHYGNDSTQKSKYVSFWQSLIGSDSAKCQIIKVLKYVSKNGQRQALFLGRYNNRDAYIFGVAGEKESKWYFTTSFSANLQFEQIIKLIPTIDSSFAEQVDQKFGKRISYEVGKTAPPFQFKDIKDKILTSERLKGKVIVLNFWSISCGPCITEIPELNNLVDKFKQENVVFIAPAFFTSYESLNENFLTKHPFNYQIVLASHDDYSITSMPTHIVIGEDMRIKARITGYSTNNIEQLKDTIEDLLKK